MLDQQNGNAEPVPDGIDAGEQLCGFCGVHTGSRLVQQQHLHVGSQCAGDLQLALLPIGQAGGGNVRLLPQAADLQQIQRLFRDLLLRLPEFRRAEHGVQQIVVQILAEGHLDVFDNGHIREQADILEGAGNAGLHELVNLFAVQRDAVQQDGSLRGDIHAGEQVEHGGFPGAVGADEAHQLPGADGKVEILHGVQTAEGNAQMLCLQHRLFQCFRHDVRPPSARICGPCALRGALRATEERRTGRIPCCP